MEESLLDGVSSCLSHVFHEPTKGLEKAFHLVLNAIKKQGSEQRRLKDLYNDLENKNESINEQIERSHNLLREAFEKKHQELEGRNQETVNTLMEDNKLLSEKFYELKEDHVLAKKDIDNLREELKVMAFNLQLEVCDEQSLVVEGDSSKLENIHDQKSVDYNPHENDSDIGETLHVTEELKESSESDMRSLQESLSQNVQVDPSSQKSSAEETSQEGSIIVVTSSSKPETISLQNLAQNDAVERFTQKFSIEEKNEECSDNLVSSSDSYDTKEGYNDLIVETFETNKCANVDGKDEKEKSFEGETTYSDVKKDSVKTNDADINTNGGGDNIIRNDRLNVDAGDSSTSSNTSGNHHKNLLTSKLVRRAARRASVTSQKLQVHETLAARLDRMEGDRERLKNEVSQLKSLVQNKESKGITKLYVGNGQHSNGNVENILLDVKKRIGGLEAFLSGFGTIDGMDGNDKGNEEIGDKLFQELEIAQGSVSVRAKKSNTQKEEESQIFANSDVEPLYEERLAKESFQRDAGNVQHTNNSEENESNEQSSGESKTYTPTKNESPILNIGAEKSHHVGDRGTLQRNAQIGNTQTSQDSNKMEALSIVKLSGENNGNEVTKKQENSEADEDSKEISNSKTSQQPGSLNQGAAGYTDIRLGNSQGNDDCTTVASRQKESYLSVLQKSTFNIDGLRGDEETPVSPKLSKVDENQCYNTEDPSYADFNKSLGNTVQPMNASVKLPSTNRNHFTTTRQSLLMHLVHQETMFKDQLGGIVLRMSMLEREYKILTNTSQSNSKDLREIPPNDAAKESIPKRTEFIISDLQEGSLNAKALTKQLHDLSVSVSKLATNLDSKVSKNALSMKLQSLSFNVNDELSVHTELPDPDGILLKEFKMVTQQQLDDLQAHKVDKVQSSNSDQYEESKDSTIDVMHRMLGAHEEKLMKSLVYVESEVKDCKQCINNLEEAQKHNYTSRPDQELDIEERIKEATSLVELNLHEVISNRLDRLKTVEDEVERVASRLADKPDQDQINNMLNDLEAAVSKRLGNDNTFEALLDSMKSELKQRMTRAEVISMVKQLVKSAKENIQTGHNSLMIGHAPFRCLACNELNPDGINRQLAAKVNHNALPSIHGGLTPIHSMHLNLQSFSRPNKLLSQYNRSSFPGRTNKARSTSELRISRRSKSMDSRHYNRYR